jgi:hypothetical protein
MDESPRAADEKPDEKSRIDYKGWISLTLQIPAAIATIITLVVGGSAAATAVAVTVTVKIVTSSLNPSPVVTRAPIQSNSPVSLPPDVGPGAAVDSKTVKIPDGGSLSYSNGAINEVIFVYTANIGWLTAGPDVNLEILKGPAPATNSAYRACEGLSPNKYTQNFHLNTLAPGDSLCAFAANNQVTWVRFPGPPAGQGASDLTVSEITWSGPGS